MQKKLATILTAFTILFAFQANAVELSIPLECHMGKECFIQNYFDQSRTPRIWKDYHCGSLSYDGHDGTDFRLKDLVAMRQGVYVIAAADGIVRATRDGMEDINVNDANPDDVKNRECGNGVVITHIDGYETQYCHMKKNSIMVQKDDIIKKGQRLGQVGLSGETEFPHLHFSVRHRTVEVDPFVNNDDPSSQCPRSTVDTLWSGIAQEELGYVSSALLNGFFTSDIPNAKEARDGLFREPSVARDIDQLLFWVDVMGAREGDILKVSMHYPDGKVIAEKSHTFDRSKALYFQYIGKKAKQSFWPRGTYTGKVKLIRADGSTVFNEERTANIL